MPKTTDIIVNKWRVRLRTDPGGLVLFVEPHANQPGSPARPPYRRFYSRTTHRKLLAADLKIISEAHAKNKKLLVDVIAGSTVWQIDRLHT